MNRGLLFFIALCILPGCVSTERIADSSRPLLPPLLPLQPRYYPAATVAQVDAQLRQNPDYSPGPAGRPDHLIVAYIASGRDFDPLPPDAEPNEPAASSGPNGYLLRVIALDTQDKSVALSGDVTIYLFPGEPRHCDPNLAALHVWQVPSRALDAYWTRTSLLDSYIFRLSWQDRDPGPGAYFLAVTTPIPYQKKCLQLCGTVAFVDDMSRAAVIPETSSPRPNLNISQNGVKP